MIAQHAIGKPAFQRHCLELISRAVTMEDVPPQQEAYLVDRIRFNERRPQVYGTIFDWNENGQISFWEIEDFETVETRRMKVGLPPLAENLRRIRKQAGEEGNAPPADFAVRQQEIEKWAKKVGWIEARDA